MTTPSVPMMYLIRIDGVAGTSAIDGFEDYIDLLSFSQSGGVSTSLTERGLTAGPLGLSDISVSLMDNAALVKLMEASTEGEYIPGVQIVGLRLDNRAEEPVQVVYDMRLNTVAVSNTSFDGSAVTALFDFDAIGLRQSAFDPDSGLSVVQEYGYNVETDEEIGFESLNTPTTSSVSSDESTGGPDGLYMWIEGIAGDSILDGYEGWFKLDALSGGVSLEIGDGPQRGSSSTYDPLSVVFQSPASEGKLLEYLQSGLKLTNVEIVQLRRDADLNTFKAFEVQMEGVRVTSLSSSETASDISQVMSLEFDSIETTTRTARNGAISDNSFGWDLAGRRPDDLTFQAGETMAELFAQPTSYFMQIDGVTGPSVASGREGWFELTSVQTNWATGEFGRAGPGTLTVQMEGADAELHAMLASATAANAVLIQGVTGDGSGRAFEVVSETVLNRALLTGLSSSGSSNGEPESVGLSFEFEQYGLTRQTVDRSGQAAGEVEFGFDTITRTVLSPDDLDRPGEVIFVGTPLDIDNVDNVVDENSAVGTTVGITIDASNAVRYEMVSNPHGLFAINATTGVVTVAGALDYETYGAIQTITVSATAANDRSSSNTFSIFVNDITDATPVGTDGAFLIEGTTRDDDLIGDVGDDTIEGFDGNDTLTGGAGNDIILGGGGTDVVVFDDIDSSEISVFAAATGLQITSALGVDLVGYDVENLQFDDVTLTVDEIRATAPSLIEGTSGNDLLFGTTGDDSILGDADNDTIRGDLGNDTLRGGTGADRLDGQDGQDDIFGGLGDDYLYGDGIKATTIADIPDQVFRLYQTTLNRAPEITGYLDWITQLFEGQVSVSTTAAGFVYSREFRDVYDSLDNADFIELLYQNVLGRGSDTDGFNLWNDRLANGMLREEVVLGFSDSAEFITATRADARAFAENHTNSVWSDDVYRLYQATLDRAPEFEGFKGWIESLGRGTPFETAVGGFVASLEFQNTYGELTDEAFINQLYNNVLGRDGDTAGIDGWLDTIMEGGTREAVVEGFSQSIEFVNATQADVKEWVREQGTDDVLNGGGGSNILTGGMLSDQFVFVAADQGTNRVMDLEPWDTLDFRGFGYANQEAVREHLSQSGDDVVFTDQGTVITFQNTSLSLFEDDMILV